MKSKQVTLRIHREKVGQPARFQDFPVVVEEGRSVLDLLLEIRCRLDPALQFRSACHHSSCGTCALRINGKERLACLTGVFELETEIILLEPLAGLPTLGDLVVDMQEFFGRLPAELDYLREAEPLGEGNFFRFEDCIECGACYSACPVVREQAAFPGPAALVRINRGIINTPASAEMLLDAAGKEAGPAFCRRVLACNRVCPTGVFPARHIQWLRKRLDS